VSNELLTAGDRASWWSYRQSPAGKARESGGRGLLARTAAQQAPRPWPAGRTRVTSPATVEMFV